MLTARIPVLSDVMGRTITFLDIAKAFGVAEAADYVAAAKKLIELANTPIIGGNVEISVGSFSLALNPSRSGLAGAPPSGGSVHALATAEDFLPPELAEDWRSTVNARTNPGADLPPDAANYMKKAGSSSGNALGFPLLENPKSAFKLLLGQDVDLFYYDRPRLAVGFEYISPFISIVGPLGARFGGGVEVAINLAFGFDTYGLRQFFPRRISAIFSKDVLSVIWIDGGAMCPRLN